ncbi:MAG TPA: hypothetical protein VLA52_14155 [Thermohalobaculum sp.]|nr:hypothetical protein [Thermohalobaculum sp.]
MLKYKIVKSFGTAAAALTLAALVAGNPAFAGGELRLRAELSAAAGDISGQADFRNRTNKNRRQWSVQVEGLTPGDLYDVVVSGETVGTIVIDGFGIGDQNFDDNFEAGDDPATQFPANFPNLDGGEMVVVGPLSGTLQPK